MTRNRLYTIVLDYKGGTYIGQAHSDSLSGALAQWLSRIGDQELAKWKITRDKLLDIFTSDEPIPLSGCTNVWCLSASTNGGLALINVIATDQSTDESLTTGAARRG